MNKRIFLFSISLILLIVSSVYFLHLENSACLGVKTVDIENVTDGKTYSYFDYSKDIYFEGEPAAIDVEHSVIYIPQRIDSSIKKKNLQGVISLKNYNCDLFIANDDNFDDLVKSTSNGYKYKLYVVNKENGYMIYDIIFTTLPVLKIDGSFVENSEEVMSGSICLWPSNSSEDDHYVVETSNAEWRVRGDTTKILDKKSFKLNLKNKKGENRNIDLLGLGSDDDWMLNAMRVDDSKIREMLFMRLWNEMCETTDYNYPMSNAKYVELVVNDEYRGLYLLQNRVDKKYLKLDDEDVILKGKRYYGDYNSKYVYTIKYSPLSEEETYKLIDTRWNNDEVYTDERNIIDLTIFLQLSTAIDNTTYMNMYYIFENIEDDYRHVLIPWDTDLTFGINWDGTYKNDYEVCLTRDLQREEIIELIKKNPDIERQICLRWKELNSGLLSEENIVSNILELNDEIKNSGAYTREFERWNFFCGDDDPQGNMIDFVDKRIDWMNERYQINK